MIVQEARWHGGQRIAFHCWRCRGKTTIEVAGLCEWVALPRGWKCVGQDLWCPACLGDVANTGATTCR